jgi:hypothetical protein
MTWLLIPAAWVAFTVVMVLALTYSGRTPGDTPGRYDDVQTVTFECGPLDETFAWIDAVDAMPDVTANFAHILAEHSERTEP